MSLSANYISQLDQNTPDGSTELVSALDDYIRRIFLVLQTQFPNLGAAAVTGTAAQVNQAVTLGINAAANGGAVYVNTKGAANGVASLDSSGLIPTAQIPDLPYLAGPSGTNMLFAQASAPTGWTAQTLFSDYALRLTTPAGYVGFNNISSPTFSSRFATGQTTSANSGLENFREEAGSNNTIVASNGHTHTVDMDVRYVDIISAARD